jgi:hypothetical protein
MRRLAFSFFRVAATCDPGPTQCTGPIDFESFQGMLERGEKALAFSGEKARPEDIQCAV